MIDIEPLPSTRGDQVIIAIDGKNVRITAIPDHVLVRLFIKTSSELPATIIEYANAGDRGVVCTLRREYPVNTHGRVVFERVIARMR